MNQPKLLIVEDDPINLQTLTALLSPQYQTLVAKSGEEALKRLTNMTVPPDLVLLDIMLPGINGYEVCQRLKQEPHTANLPIIFLTAKTDVESEALGFELGGVDFIHKPFHETIVLARVKNHIELKRRGDLLEQLSTLDPLTQLNNRRRFDLFLNFEWNRAARLKNPLTVILMDIDHFKLYNDTYGHAGGDQCLISVGRVLSSVTKRATDFVGRYGGEEFVCVLPETGEEGGLAMGERIRQGVAALAIPHAASKTTDHVTMSLGVATVVPHSDMLPIGLVEMADEALYHSKKNGRNRVSLFQPENEPLSP